MRLIGGRLQTKISKLNRLFDSQVEIPADPYMSQTFPVLWLLPWLLRNSDEGKKFVGCVQVP